MATGSNCGRHSYAGRSSGSNQSGAQFYASLYILDIAQLTLPEGLGHLPPTKAAHSPGGSTGSNWNTVVSSVGPSAAHSTPIISDTNMSVGPSRDTRQRFEVVEKILEPSERVKHCMLNLYHDQMQKVGYK